MGVGLPFVYVLPVTPPELMVIIMVAGPCFHFTTYQFEATFFQDDLIAFQTYRGTGDPIYGSVVTSFRNGEHRAEGNTLPPCGYRARVLVLDGLQIGSNLG